MDTRARHAPLGKNLTGVKDRACRRGYCIGGPDYAPEPLWPTMSKLLSQEAVRTGIMVAMRLEGPILCPFFACCDGVVVFSADGDRNLSRRPGLRSARHQIGRAHV